MTFIPTIPSGSLMERFEADNPQRSTTVVSLPIENTTTFYCEKLRFAEQEHSSVLLFSSALPLILWAGQEAEAEADAGGTWVLLICCAISLFIFSKTGWRNELPK